MTDTRTALIIGGGIAGPVAGMALQKAGIEATVYEAYGDTAGGIGGGLSIAPNGLNALGVVGVDEPIRRIGEPITAMVIQSWTGKQLAEFRGMPGLPPQQFVYRSDLYRTLHDEAAGRGIRSEYGRKLVDVTDAGGAVTAHFADGTEATADILIGADGIRSTVRSLIDPAAPQPRYAGLLNFAGRMDDTGLTSTEGRMHMVFGRRAFFGYQVLDDGSGGWFVNLPHAAVSRTEVNEIGTEQWRRILCNAFADDRSPALELIGRTAQDDFLVIGPMEDIPSVPTWSNGRMVLIGDAAHATSPSSGQGASLAAESAVQLARCLRDQPLDQAFSVYEQLRRARVEKVIAMAARTNSNKAAGPIARVIRDLVMPMAMKSLAKPEKLAWQYDHHIDWDARVTGAPPPVTVAA